MATKKESTGEKADAISVASQAVPAQPMPTRRNFRNIAGQRFFHLTAIEYVGLKGRVAAWKCQCDCGRYCIATSNLLLEAGKKQCYACGRAILSTKMIRFHETLQANRLPNLYKGASEKPCCECREVKILHEFTRRKNEPDGLSRQCRSCLKSRRDEWIRKNQQHVRNSNLEPTRRYRAAHPERVAGAMMRCKYGIGLEEYHAMLAAQGERCAICGAPPIVRPHSTRKTLCIDHDHATGKIRGLLCRQCNHGLGCFADNPSSLESAAAYLRSSGGSAW